jgi:hypothetical protein
MATLFTRKRLPRHQEPTDDIEELHPCQPNAPWAGLAWAVFWFVVLAVVAGAWLAPWLADKAIP